jgi:hypothetical protein
MRTPEICRYRVLADIEEAAERLRARWALLSNGGTRVYLRTPVSNFHLLITEERKGAPADNVLWTIYRRSSKSGPRAVVLDLTSASLAELVALRRRLTRTVSFPAPKGAIVV